MSSIATTYGSAMCVVAEEKNSFVRTSTSELKLKTQMIKMSRTQVELKHQVACLAKDKKRLEARVESLLKVVASHGAEKNQLQLQLDAQEAAAARKVAAFQDAFIMEHGRAAEAFERQTALLQEQLAQAKRLQEQMAEQLQERMGKQLKPCSVDVATDVPSSASYTPSLIMMESPTSKVTNSLRTAVETPTPKLQDSTPTTPPSRKRSASSMECVSPPQERRVRRKRSVEWTIDFLAL